ncbi:hypothetical protein PHET_10974 [Paragonimus heterotremus]|uniref:Uncharacterized protein n=1 Tax=Paragonimus heterotremus TaxID=100268 RepID=A0A8J4T094_9TREM|nr:hypothetical protein PHET_10971 [Paragonimus heterotremus]KAF5394604.1 hypothetical protein PHET_10974 [Paragonimus heterotremus]
MSFRRKGRRYTSAPNLIDGCLACFRMRVVYHNQIFFTYPIHHTSGYYFLTSAPQEVMYSLICMTAILQLLPKSHAEMAGFVLSTTKSSHQSIEHLPWSLEQLNMLYQQYNFHGRKLRQIHLVFLNRIHEPVDMSCWSQRLFESTENENEQHPRYHKNWFIKEINLTKTEKPYSEYMTERSSAALRVDPLTAIRDKVSFVAISGFILYTVFKHKLVKVDK